MATAPGKWYGQAFLKAFNKEINFLTDSIKIMLCTNAYTPDQDAHIYKSSVTNEVAATGGYVAGGFALANKTATYTAGTNVIKFDADDLVINSSTITARYGIIYDDTPSTDATKPLLGFIDFLSDIVSSGAAFTVQFDAAGILLMTPA